MYVQLCAESGHRSGGLLRFVSAYVCCVILARADLLKLVKVGVKIIIKSYVTHVLIVDMAIIYLT